MAKLNVYVNFNGGSPKMWCYSSESGATRIAWGGCFKGGHQKDTKDASYGRAKAKEKSGEGYTPCGTFDFTGPFDAAVDSLWSDLRAISSRAINMATDRANVLRDVLDSAQQRSAKRNVVSASAPPDPPPAPPPKQKSISLTSVLKDDAGASASPYDW